MSDLISGYLFYSLVIVVLIVIVGGGIYLILRPLVLWYFKIYSIESELQENNALLRGILDELAKRMYKHHLLTNQKKTIVSICQGKKEMVKCKVEKYTFFYIIALV